MFLCVWRIFGARPCAKNKKTTQRREMRDAKSLEKSRVFQHHANPRNGNYTIRNQQVAGSSPASSSIVGIDSVRLRNGNRLWRLPFLRLYFVIPPLPRRSTLRRGPRYDPSARLKKSSRSESGCFFFGCAPGLLLLPMQPASPGLHGVPFCPGFI